MNRSGLLKRIQPEEIVRLPLRLLPPKMVVPILYGALRGRRWIVGAAIHRCWIGFYEYTKQQLIAREVRKGSVFWDVGANVGFYTLLASRLVGSGKVFAFEPVHRNLYYLQEHIRLNCISNVEVVPVAVSDKNGTSAFAVEESGFMGHLSEEGEVTVPTATMDLLVEQGKVLPPDYVKMDIEGAELLALLGASRTFQRFRPMLFLATHGRKVKTQCCELLESWGYECSNVHSEPSGELSEVVARYRGRLDFGGTSKVLTYTQAR